MKVKLYKNTNFQINIQKNKQFQILRGQMIYQKQNNADSSIEQNSSFNHQILEIQPQLKQSANCLDKTSSQSAQMNYLDNYPDQFHNQQRHFGTMLPFFLGQNNQPKYVLGPHYYVFIITVLLSSWFLWYSIQTYHHQIKMDLYPLLACSFSALFYVISYIRIGISNPGIASSNQLPDIQTQLNPKFCKPCKILKSNKTRHCYYCDVCIYQMDHHCPWVGKCIGRNNIKLFALFIFSIILNLAVFSVCLYFYSINKPPKFI